MLNLSELENLHADIQTVYELVQTFEARIDGKEIVVKIFRNRDEHYFYEVSHFYRGADNDTDSHMPHNLTVNRFTSIEEAAKGALRSATGFYRSTDEGGRWVKNESFIQ
ncbi:MAG: hypothetical protein K0S39_5026 [Paenibacillus sp.]|jgi:hypothetical protein|nr:hypothetical protein [Paenibacillus sp.]